MPHFLILSYGSEINGLISTLKQIVSYATLIEAGLSGAAIYMLYKPLAKKNYEEVDSIVTSSKIFYSKSGWFFLGIVTIIAILSPILIYSQNIETAQIISLVFILGTNGALEFFVMGKYRVLITASQRGYVISLIQALSIIVNTIIIVVGSILKINIVILQLVATISFVIRATLMYAYAKRKYKEITYKSKKEIKLNQKNDVLLHQIGGMVVFNTPVVIVSLTCGLSDASIYSIYHMILMGLINLVSILNTSLSPIFGNIIQSENEDSIKTKYEFVESCVYFICRIIYSILILVINQFLIIYTRNFDGNYINKYLITILISCAVIHSLKTPQSMIITAAGHFKKTKFKTINETVICIIISTISTFMFGVSGVLLGMLISSLYRLIDSYIYVHKNIIKYNKKNTVKKLMIYILSILFSIIMLYVMRNIYIYNLIDFIVYVIIISVIVIIINLIIFVYVEKNEFNFIKERYIKKSSI